MSGDVQLQKTRLAEVLQVRKYETSETVARKGGLLYTSNGRQMTQHSSLRHATMDIKHSTVPTIQTDTMSSCFENWL